MKHVNKYQCEICGKMYDSPDAAEDCEKQKTASGIKPNTFFMGTDRTMNVILSVRDVGEHKIEIETKKVQCIGEMISGELIDRYNAILYYNSWRPKFLPPNVNSPLLWIGINRVMEDPEINESLLPKLDGIYCWNGFESVPLADYVACSSLGETSEHGTRTLNKESLFEEFFHQTVLDISEINHKTNIIWLRNTHNRIFTLTKKLIKEIEVIKIDRLNSTPKFKLVRNLIPEIVKSELKSGQECPQFRNADSDDEFLAKLGEKFMEESAELNEVIQSLLVFAKENPRKESEIAAYRRDVYEESCDIADALASLISHFRWSNNSVFNSSKKNEKGGFGHRWLMEVNKSNG